MWYAVRGRCGFFGIERVSIGDDGEDDELLGTMLCSVAVAIDDDDDDDDDNEVVVDVIIVLNDSGCCRWKYMDDLVMFYIMRE